MSTVRPGRYRHFKGNEYEVIGVARPAEKILSGILLLHKKDPCMPCCNKI